MNGTSDGTDPHPAPANSWAWAQQAQAQAQALGLLLGQDQAQVQVPPIHPYYLYPFLRDAFEPFPPSHKTNKCVYCHNECLADNHRLVCASCGINTAHYHCTVYYRSWWNDIEQPMINGSWFCTKKCYLHCPKSGLTPGA